MIHHTKHFILNTRFVYRIVFLFCVVVFVLHYLVAGQAVYGDGIDYYAYLHTVYFDKDINFENEFRHIYSYQNNNFTGLLADDILKTRRLQNGKVDNIHPPGPAILLFPFYVLADVLVVIFNFFDMNVPRNGYSDTYQIAVGIGAIVYMLLGIRLMELVLLKLFPAKSGTDHLLVIRFVVFGLFFATSLFYYGAVDVINSHAVSFFLTSLFLALLILKPIADVYLYPFLGFVLGLAIMSRPQDGLLFFVLLLFTWFQNTSKRYSKKLLLVTSKAIIVGIFCFITVLPMVYIWHELYGGWFRSGFIFEQPFTDLTGSLFQNQNGLLSRTPLLLISLIAYPFLFLRYRILTIILTLFFLANLLVITKHGGWAFPAYGGRMYLSSFLLFFLLLATLFFYLYRRGLLAVIVLLVFFFSVLNMFRIVSFMAFEKEASGQTRGIEAYTIQRMQEFLPKPILRLLNIQ